MKIKTVLAKIKDSDIDSILWVIKRLQRPESSEDLAEIEHRIKAIKTLENVLSKMIMARMSYDEKMGEKK
jgi:hypothetical protein